MDRLSRAWYQRETELLLRKKQGNEFQDFFSDCMELAHPGDFQRIRPYGNRGDLKCDGYVESTQTVFQAYAPRQIKKLADLLEKIQIDFDGACRHWQGRMREWTFVHNDWEGLPSDAMQLLQDISLKNPTIRIGRISPQELQTRVLQLPEEHLSSLFGPAPNYQLLESLGFDRLRPVLLNIKRQEAPPLSNIRPVSPEKLSANAFTQHVVVLLKSGRHKEALVEKLLAGWPDLRFGEELANAFRKRYQEAETCGLTADEIFGELQVFAGGSQVAADPSHQAAVLAVLSYFFERCDIFKDHPEAAQ